MEQLIHAFGLDPKLIIVQIINFVLLAAGLTYFLYKPLLNMIATREAKIEQGIKDAEEAAKARATADEEKKDILSAAQTRAEEMSAHAKKFADEEANGIVASAREKAAILLRDAEDKAAAAAEQALKESEAEITKAAVLAAEKVLREQAS